MGRRSSLALAILLVAGGGQSASAQTAENLQRAIRFYEGLEVDRARDVFLQVISPSSPFEVTPAQRATAYIYLGATLATLGQPDSARTYFQAAIERDPFADLDPAKFSAQERQVFAAAKQRVFKVAARPLGWTSERPTGVPVRIDPRTQPLKFSVVTTHSANLVVEVHNVDDGTTIALYAGENDGLRELSWNGSLQRGGLVPTGPYELAITGTSMRATGGRDSTKILFDITQEHGALEDTLRSLAPGDLLPERYTISAARKNLFLGAIVTAVAVAIPLTVGAGSLDMPAGPAIGVGAVGALTGVVAYLSLTQKPEIPENVAENARRRAARDQANQAIVSRNNAKLAETRLLFTPIAATVQ